MCIKEGKRIKKEIHNNLIETENLLQSIESADTVLFSKWMKEKSLMRYKGNIPKIHIIDNFIYWCNLGINIGSEQEKLRPVLVFNTSKKSSICTIIPLTTKRLNDEFWYHIDLKEIDSTALVEQLRVVSKIRIKDAYRVKGKMYAIQEEDWNNINKQLNRIYRLKPLK